jgi:hypothetical protein
VGPRIDLDPRAISNENPPSSLRTIILCKLQTRTANGLESTLREAYPDGDLAVLAGDCSLEIPRYLQTLTVDWRRYVFLVR